MIDIPPVSDAIAEVADAPPSPGHGLEIAPGVLWLRMPLPFALDHVNLWLIGEPDGYTLVDCGYGDATTRAHWQRHFETTLLHRPIRRIIATHCHPDHLGNAAWLAARFGCTIAMTLGEYLAAHALIGEQAGFGSADVRALFARHGMAAEHLAALVARGNHYHRGVPEAPHAFARLIDGDVLRAGPWQLAGVRRLRTFAGARGAGEPRGGAADRGRHAAAADQHQRHRLAVRTRRRPARALSRVAVGLRGAAARHAGAAVAWAAVSRHRGARRETAPASRMRAWTNCTRRSAGAHAPQSAAEVIPVLFRRELDLQQRFFAMGEAIAHLNHLWQTGRAQRSVAADGAIRFARRERSQSVRAIAWPGAA